MRSIKFSLCLILALLATTTFTTETPAAEEELRCTHDDQEHKEPELLDIAEDYNPEGNNHEGRTLQDYQPFRTHATYGLLSSAPTSYSTYMSQNLIPPIIDYFAAALKVKYPVTGLLQYTSSSICGVTTPSILKTGVSADYVLMVDHDYQSAAWVAECKVCYSAKGSRRPLIAKAKVNRYKLKATTDVLVHEKNMMCIMHEITHSLGLTNSLFRSFLDSNGKTLTGHIISGKTDGSTNTVLAIEPVRTRLREHFGCSTLGGLYIENGGGSGTAGSHPERRHFALDYMTSGLSHQMQVTEMTLSFLESTGWYVADYTYGEPFYYGKNQGCNFLTATCSGSGFEYNTNGFCSGSSRGCAHPGRGGGSCQTDRITPCKFIHPTGTNYDCDNDKADSYARLPSAETYGRAQNSKCFTGTLSSTSSSASSTTFCFKFECSGSGSETVLNVKVGSKVGVCTQKGSITIDGYKGKINCPEPQEWCETVGTKKCLRGCMGRGACVDGVCQCNSGFRGKDCALSTSF